MVFSSPQTITTLCQFRRWRTREGEKANSLARNIYLFAIWPSELRTNKKVSKYGVRVKVSKNRKTEKNRRKNDNANICSTTRSASFHTWTHFPLQGASFPYFFHKVSLSPPPLVVSTLAIFCLFSPPKYRSRKICQGCQKHISKSKQVHWFEV